MSESIYYALTLFPILPLMALWFFPLRYFLRHPPYVCVLMSLAIYSLLFFLAPPFLRYSNGHYLLVMIFILCILFFVLTLTVRLDMLRCMVVFLWGCGLISFASSITRAIVIFYSEGGVFQPDSLQVQIIRAVIATLIAVAVSIYTSFWNEGFVTDPNVPMNLWLIFLPLPVVLFYINTILIAYNDNMIGSNQEMYSYAMILMGNLVLYLLLTQIFYQSASIYVENARVSEQKRMLEFQKAQFADMQHHVDHTNKLLHDFKHSINTLRTMATEDGAENILAYLDTLNDLPSGTELMNYCKNPAINSVLNHYAFRAKQTGVPLNLQVDIPPTLPLEDALMCSLIGNLMENAIDATSILPAERRKFSLSLVMKGINLYIVSSNTFNGHLVKSGEFYVSTKHSGFGIGIRSMKETVEKYGGTLNIHHSGDQFFVDITLSFPD